MNSMDSFINKNPDAKENPQLDGMVLNSDYKHIFLHVLHNYTTALLPKTFSKVQEERKCKKTSDFKFSPGIVIVPTGGCPNSHCYKMDLPIEAVPHIEQSSDKDYFFKFGKAKEKGNHMTRQREYARAP